MHRHTRTAALVAGLAAAAVIGSAATAAAQLPDTKERTKITIDKAVEIPGTTLQPGTYWFQLVNSDATRQNITVKNADESESVATLIAVPIYRDLNSTRGKTELVLRGTEGPGAAVLDAWFFPGMQYGHEFVYPKEQARQIASRIKAVVLADEDGKVVRLNPAGISEPWAPDTTHPVATSGTMDKDKSDKADKSDKSDADHKDHKDKNDQ